MVKKFSIWESLWSKSLLLKLSWLIVLTLSVFCLGFYIGECYTKLKMSPEVLVNEKFVNSRTVPFPAVTICSSLQTKSSTLNLSKFVDDVSSNASLKSDELEIMEALSHVCPTNWKLLKRIPNKKLVGGKISKILDKIFLKMDDVLETCSIDGFEGCENIFIRSLTYLGYCYSFNMLGYHSLFNKNIDSLFDAYKRKTITKSWNMDADIELFDDDEEVEPPKWTIEEGYTTNDDHVMPVRASGWRSIPSVFSFTK